MTEFSYPFDSANAGEPEWSTMARRWWGVCGTVGGPGSSAGAVSADGIGTRQIYIQPQEAQLLGFYYKSDALITLNAAVNGSGLPRIDRVVLRLNTATNSIVAAILQGTPNASPVAPATSTADASFEYSLAQISVPAGATSFTAANILLDERIWQGLRAVTLASLTSPLPTDIQVGAPVWVNDRQRWMVYDGVTLGILDPRKPVAYGAGTINQSNVLAATNKVETTAVSLVIPASTAGVGNRYVIIGAKVFLSMSVADTPVNVRLKGSNIENDSGQLVNLLGGSISMFHHGVIGPAPYTITVTVQRISGTGTASWSLFGSASYIKATVIPTD